MTLREAYPYWVLREIPPSELPFIATNDMLSGNLSDEVVAIAALSKPDDWELDRLLPRAFQKLEVSPLTHEEAARAVALPKMKMVAKKIVNHEISPKDGANAIYFIASDADLVLGTNSELDNEASLARDYGLRFLSMPDVVEEGWSESRDVEFYERRIVDTAMALLDEQSSHD